MESRNLAVPIGVFVVAAIGLAIALSPARKSEDESTSRPTTGMSATTTPATTHTAATTKHS
jgi:hypothetical protein